MQRRQPCHRRRHLGCPLTRKHDVLGPGARSGDSAQLRVLYALRRATAQTVPRLAARDPEQPRRHLRAPLEASRTPPHSDQRVLQDLLSDPTVRRLRQQEREQRPPPPLVEHHQRAPVTRGHHDDQLSVHSTAHHRPRIPDHGRHLRSSSRPVCSSRPDESSLTIARGPTTRLGAHLNTPCWGSVGWSANSLAQARSILCTAMGQNTARCSRSTNEFSATAQPRSWGAGRVR